MEQRKSLSREGADNLTEVGGGRICRIEMFGGMSFSVAGHWETRFRFSKAASLLAYLAVRGKPQAREHLVDLFWPELDLPVGRDNLSTVLASLRRQLEPAGEVRRGAVLIANHSEIGLNPTAVSSDVAEFERLLERAYRGDPDDSSERAKLLGKAVALYRGDFLPGIYDDWAVRESERLQARYLQTLEGLASDLEQIGDLEGALRAAQLALAVDPYVEGAQSGAIRLQIELGRPGAALAAFQALELLWRDEFGGGPPEAIRALVEPLRLSLGSRHKPPAKSRARAKEEAIVAARMIEPSAAGRREESVKTLPVFADRFFGREIDTARLARMLLPSKGAADAPGAPDSGARLVTLLGAGGIGKTRLAVEFSHQAEAHFNVRCHFVSLAETADSGQILAKIAETLPPDQGERTPIERVAEFFDSQDRIGGRAPVLVLDNLEQLLIDDSDVRRVAEAVGSIMRAVPYLPCLCTSRRALRIRGERLLPIEPLPTPPSPPLADADTHTPASDGEVALLLNYPSVRLYIDRAQAVRPDFGLTPINASSVSGLCAMLEGSPLALELAASWVRSYPPRKMWERLTREAGGIGNLESRYADVPARQRSLRAALDWSFRLLRPDEQRLLDRLSVFRGGWPAEAAATICDEPDAQSLIERLEDASLIRPMDPVAPSEETEPRWTFLETVRNYCRLRLGESGEADAIRRRHAEYFAALAFDAEPNLRGPDQARWLARLETEHDNLRAAADALAESPEMREEHLRMLCALTRFWMVRGHWAEPRRRLSVALAAFESEPTSPLIAQGLHALGVLLKLQGEFLEAREIFLKSLAMRRELGDRGKVADLLHNLALIELERGNFDDAQPLYEESLAIQRELGDTLAIADELHHLGYLAQERADYARAQSLYDESLIIRRPLGDLRGIAYTLNNMANLAYSQGDRDHCRELHEQTLEIRRALGDRKGEALVLCGMGGAALEDGDDAAAKSLLAEALSIRGAIGDKLGVSECLAGLALIAQRQGRLAHAATLAGASEALREAVGANFRRFSEIDQVTKQHHAEIAAGRAMPWRKAVELATEDT